MLVTGFHPGDAKRGATLGTLSGLGPFLHENPTQAMAQVLTISSIKFVWAGLLLTYRPVADGLDNAVVATQFVSEALASALTLFKDRGMIGGRDAQTVELTTFCLLLMPVFFPIFMRVYDLIVVQIVMNCCRKKFNARAAFIAMLAALMSVTKLILTKFGVTASFNPSALVRTLKQLNVDSAQQQTVTGKGQRVKVKRTVRRRRGDDASMEAMVTAGCSLEALTLVPFYTPVTGANDSMKADNADGDDGGDDGGGDDGGGDDGGGDDGGGDAGGE